MVGLERVYNFHELVEIAHMLNHLAGVAYGENDSSMTSCTIRW
jgi:hypothetical protein